MNDSTAARSAGAAKAAECADKGLKKLYIETYGCQMNVADSEVVASVMGIAGYEPVESAEEADAVILNTCSIRDNAEQKIFSRLQYLGSLRRRKGGRLIIGVIGCMAERVKDTLSSDHGVDLERIREHHARVQQLLFLLHSALHPRARAQPRAGEHPARGGRPQGARISRSE